MSGGIHWARRTHLTQLRGTIFVPWAPRSTHRVGAWALFSTDVTAFAIAVSHPEFATKSDKPLFFTEQVDR